MKDMVDIIGVPFKQVVSEACCICGDGSARIDDLLYSKACVNLLGYPFQVELFRAVVKESCGGVEHVFEDMTIAAREDEQAIVQNFSIIQILL